MKNTLAVLALLISSLALAESPYEPQLDARLDALEAGTSLATGAVTSAAILDGTIVAGDVASDTGASGIWVHKRVSAIYDFTVNGGVQAGHLTGLTLPTGAIVTKSFIYVNTQLRPAGTTIAFHCLTANNLYTATDITGFASGKILEGATFSAGASTVYKAIAATCNVTATIASQTATAGKITIFLDYIVSP